MVYIHDPRACGMSSVWPLMLCICHSDESDHHLKESPITSTSLVLSKVTLLVENGCIRDQQELEALTAGG